MYFDALLRTQHAHEILHDLARNALSGHQYRNTRWIWRDLIRANPAIQLVVYPLLFVQQRHLFAPTIESVARKILEISKARDLRDLIEAPRGSTFARDAHQCIIKT